MDGGWFCFPGSGIFGWVNSGEVVDLLFIFSFPHGSLCEGICGVVLRGDSLVSHSERLVS